MHMRRSLFQGCAALIVAGCGATPLVSEDSTDLGVVTVGGTGGPREPAA
jgi:hypothetical protein